MGDWEAQRAWIADVLGVAIPERVAARVVPLQPIWREAKEVVDVEIGKLQGALRETRTELGQAIADQGLAALTRGLQVKLMVALIEYDRGASAERGNAARRVRDAVAGLRARVLSERMFAMLDNNPFGVSVAIRSRLEQAMGAIERALV